MNMQQFGKDFMDVASCIIPLVGFIYLVWRHMHKLVTTDERQAAERGASQPPATGTSSPKSSNKPLTQRIKAKNWLVLVNQLPDMYPHLFLVGKTRSGKTLTCQAIVAQRPGLVCIIDPKDRPGKWGAVRAVALDDDLSYTGIEATCQALLDVLKHRQRAMNQGLTDFETITVVIDELPVVVAECPTAATLYKKIGQIGAELRVRLIALSQSDRVKTIGLSGEGDSRDNFLYLAFGNKARDIAYNVTLPQYPCVAKLDDGLAIFDSRDVPKLARYGIASQRLWEAPVSTASTAWETEITAMGSVDGSTASTGQNGEESATGSGVEDWQRQAILAFARQGLSRRKVSERVFGGSGGRDYEKVKAVLDEAGL